MCVAQIVAQEVLGPRATPSRRPHVISRCSRWVAYASPSKTMLWWFRPLAASEPDLGLAPPIKVAPAVLVPDARAAGQHRRGELDGVLA